VPTGNVRWFARSHQEELVLTITHNESKLYGDGWDHIHGGYFSNRDVAAPLVDAVVRAVQDTGARAVADLGGGTGFVLSLVAESLAGECDLINVDSAPAQLEGAASGISAVQADLEKLDRESLIVEGSLVLCMRSVLHYFGRRGLKPALADVRSVLAEGERFVHQTACFDSKRDCKVLNDQYELMGTGKWYPTAAELRHALQSEGFKVESEESIPSLALQSGEVAYRYDVDPAEMDRIGVLLFERHGEVPGVIERDSDGYTTFLHYRIMTCAAC
jgi:SAM-dependent methyltransferase